MANNWCGVCCILKHTLRGLQRRSLGCCVPQVQVACQLLRSWRPSPWPPRHCRAPACPGAGVLHSQWPLSPFCQQTHKGLDEMEGARPLHPPISDARRPPIFVGLVPPPTLFPCIFQNNFSPPILLSPRPRAPSHLSWAVCLLWPSLLTDGPPSVPSRTRGLAVPARID